MATSAQVQHQRAGERGPAGRTVADTRGIALAPPAYGISVLDSGDIHDPAALPAPWTAIQRARMTASDRLPDTLAASLGAHASADLSGVRLHTDADSAIAAQALGARAFTVGSDIHFGAGEYDPSSRLGQHLIAHEVAHVLQQRGTPAMLQEKRELGQPADPAEIEADTFATDFLAGRPHPVAARPDAAAISCARRGARAIEPEVRGRSVSLSVGRGRGIVARIGPIMVGGRDVALALWMGLRGTVTGMTPDALPPAPARERGKQAPVDPAVDTALSKIRAAVEGATFRVSASELTVDIGGLPLRIAVTDKGAATRSVLSIHQANKQSLAAMDLVFTGSIDAEIVTTVTGTGSPGESAEGSTEALSRVSFMGKEARLVDVVEEAGKETKIVQRHDVAVAAPAAIADVLAIKAALEKAEAPEREALIAEARRKTARANEQRPPKKRLSDQVLALAEQQAGQRAVDKAAFASRQFAASIGAETAALRLLEWMRPWFGKDADTVAHFKGIRRVAGQDNLLAHESLASKLEAVQRELVARYPDTGRRPYPQSSVGWSFRGELQVGASQAHKHMHKIGMAVDFDAYNLPMMNPGTTRALVKAVTGRSNALFQAPTPKSADPDWTQRKARRAMIRSLDTSTRENAALSERQDAFLRDLAAAIDATAAASDRLRASLDETGGWSKFEALRDAWADATEMPEGEAKAAALLKVHTAIKDLLQPWLGQIDRYRKALAARSEAQYGVDITRNAPDVKPLRGLVKPLRALANRMTKKPDAKLSDDERKFIADAAARCGKPVPEPPSGREIAALLAAVTKSLSDGEAELRRRKDAKDLDAEHWFAGQLADKLVNDRAYLFGKLGYKKSKDAPGGKVRTWSESVDQPGAGQMLARGWFRVAEPGATTSTPSKDFMLAMARHGLEIGGAWESSDSMHYEVAV